MNSLSSRLRVRQGPVDPQRTGSSRTAAGDLSCRPTPSHPEFPPVLRWTFQPAAGSSLAQGRIFPAHCGCRAVPNRITTPPVSFQPSADQQSARMACFQPTAESPENRPPSERNPGLIPALFNQELAHTLGFRSRLEHFPQLAANKPVVGWKNLRSGPEVTVRSRVAYSPQWAGNYSAVGWKRIAVITRCLRRLPVSIGF